MENIGFMGVWSYYYLVLDRIDRRLFINYLEDNIDMKKNTFMVKLSGKLKFTTPELLVLTNIINNQKWRVKNLLPAPTGVSTSGQEVVKEKSPS